MARHSIFQSTTLAFFGIIAAWAFLSLLVNIPPWLGLLFDWPHLRPSLEITLIFVALGAALAFGRGGGRTVRWVLAVAIFLLSLLAIGELVARMAVGRPLNVFIDVFMIAPLVEVMGSRYSTLELAGLLFAALLGLAVALMMIAFSIGIAQAGLANRPARWFFIALAAVAVPLHIGMARVTDTDAPPAYAWEASRTAVGQAERVIEQNRLRASMLETIADDPADAMQPDDILAGLADRNVLLIYIESYGISAIEDERYARHIVPLLDSIETNLANAGFDVVSDFFESPIAGGQSWLAHATLASGLWIENQPLYDSMLTTNRRTLVHLFNDIGHESVIVMPAITMAWPEGEFYDFEHSFYRDDMGYQGPPFNWVVMPDQYTLSFFEDSIRPTLDEPFFAKIATIGGHGPWDPVAPVLQDWSEIGDGSIFHDLGTARDVPYEQDSATVQQKYANAIHANLRVFDNYLREFIDDDSLVIIVGDHQPAPLITGEDAPFSVPMHVVSRDPAILQPFRDWGFQAGMVPTRPKPHRRLDEIRDWFIEAYSRQTGNLAARD